MTLLDRFRAASTFYEFVANAKTNQELWLSVYRLARVPPELVDRARVAGDGLLLLALVEDWCGDAVNTIPVLAKLVEQVPGLELRLLARDENPDLMDSHLTAGTRSIPVVMVLDEGGVEQGRWGPRPRALQEWMQREGLALPKAERYRESRRWYARDRGRSTIEEIVSLMEQLPVPA